MSLLIPISVGELLDKISILEIKSREIHDEAKKENINRELAALQVIRHREITGSPELDALYVQLQEVNQRLWNIEDEIRLKEREQIYDKFFIELARNVYFNNDLRAQLKRRINDISGSEFTEEKSYVDV